MLVKIDPDVNFAVNHREEYEKAVTSEAELAASEKSREPHEKPYREIRGGSAVMLACLSMIGVYSMLVKALGSQRSALQVIANVPLAAFGAIIALLLVNRPTFVELSHHAWFVWPVVWIQSTLLFLAHWVGFITLIGIVSRNGIMMISHYHYLMK